MMYHAKVAERIQFWSHVGTVFDLLFGAVVIIIIYDEVPQKTQPCCLTAGLNCLCSAHREVIWPYTSVITYRREQINTFLSEVSSSWSCFASLIAPFYFASSLPLPLHSAFLLYFLTAPHHHLCSIKEPGILTLINGYFETLVCHCLSQPAFLLKSYSMPPRLARIFWPGDCVA